ncbi:MAG: hypothetical protein J5799_01580 [Bacteroidales bacterium]|nr:hypothetical protein [Bacteroidales bacterium]MBO4645931.1 hypothetical protein [Bacteroidales bacterium]
MKKLLCHIMLMLLCTAAFAQKSQSEFRFWEDSLIALRDIVMNEPNETVRLEMNEEFMTLLETVLQKPHSFEYPWDSVRNFAVLASPDKVFKIFTWHVVKKDYTVENFGFVQVYNESRKKHVLFPLYDKRGTIDYPNTQVGNHNRWYGAVYYKMIPVKEKNITYYTLLGLNGNNLFTNQKIIEILHFNKEMVPVFGARIFKNYPGKVSRVIFEYSKNASLHLNYETQEYLVSTGKYNPKTRQVDYRRVTSPMIIFDQLIPLDENVPSIPAYMVPESSLSQGFIEEDGRWLFMKSVIGSNPDKVKPDYEYKPRQIYNPNN